MDYNKIKGNNNQVSIDSFPPELLFLNGARKIRDGIPNMNYMNMPRLMEVKESAEELLEKINNFALTMPEQIREAYGYNVVDLEETESKSK